MLRSKKSFLAGITDGRDVDEINDYNLKALYDEYREKNEIDLAIEYLLRQCEDITPLALQKALYYIQGFHYAFYQTFLFSDECEAWVHGPVYRDIYFRYRDYRFDPIEGKV